jgi:hypothetical protein
MAKKFGDDVLIYSWMRNRNTLELIGIWEQIHNPDFKGLEFETFRKQAGLNSFSLTPRKWIEATAAIGFQSRAGRYGGGTYAHRDIAFEFGSWLSPEFKLYLIKEFQRLKDDENRRLSLAVEEALAQAVETDVEGTPARVFTAEHLAAIALQVGRAKDKARLLQFIESGVLDAPRFQSILARHGLADAWQKFERQFLSDAP